MFAGHAFPIISTVDSYIANKRTANLKNRGDHLTGKKKKKKSSQSLTFVLPFVKPWEFLPVTGMILFHIMHTDGTVTGATETSCVFHS